MAMAHGAMHGPPLSGGPSPAPLRYTFSRRPDASCPVSPVMALDRSVRVRLRDPLWPWDSRTPNQPQAELTQDAAQSFAPVGAQRPPIPIPQAQSQRECHSRVDSPPVQQQHCRPVHAEYFDESRVQRGYCKTHRPVNLAHLPEAERAERRKRLAEASRRAHKLGIATSCTSCRCDSDHWSC